MTDAVTEHVADVVGTILPGLHALHVRASFFFATGVFSFPTVQALYCPFLITGFLSFSHGSRVRLLCLPASVRRLPGLTYVWPHLRSEVRVIRVLFRRASSTWPLSNGSTQRSQAPIEEGRGDGDGCASSLYTPLRLASDTVTLCPCTGLHSRRSSRPQPIGVAETPLPAKSQWRTVNVQGVV